MKTVTKVLVFVVITAATAGIVSFVQYRSAKHEAELDKVNAEPHQPGIVSFKAGEPQLASIRSEVVDSEAMPAADPMIRRLPPVPVV